MKWLEENFVWIVACIVGVWLTPSMFRYAEAGRGYKALGGEMFVPFLVPLFWYLFSTVKKIFKEVWDDLK